MKWPEPENERIPEGHYRFRLNREPELVSKAIEKDGERRVIKYLKLYAVGLDDKGGSYGVVNSFVPWDQRYADLCKALKVEHGRDIEMEGGTFEADIVYEPDANNPTKSYPRIVNIVVPGEGEGDDIPF